MSPKSVLLIGNGGREHAMAWKLIQSPEVTQLFVAPGNVGTAQLSKTHNINIKVTDVNGLIDFAKLKAIDLIVVGPEAALAAGIADAAAKNGIPCFGPTQAAAQLESSKAFSKQFMQQHGIPTARYAEFNDLEPAIDYVRQESFPIVIKADGLAAGKGVVIAENLSTAEATLQDMLQNNRFGEAGHRVIIEEFLPGEELSFIAISDGKHILPLATSRDHKHRFEGDTGPNTGGMGAYSPVPISDALHTTVMNDIMQPVIDGMRAQGTPYVGFLYAGLMLDSNNQPKVLEFNCRLGDPETQPLMMRLQSDLFKLAEAAVNGQLDQQQAQWDPRAALTVVLVAAGYPGDYRQGDNITGLQQNYPDDFMVFHAGTRAQGEHIQTAGGRVLGVTALGETLQKAQEKAYELSRSVTWDGCQCRLDIGWRGLKES